eukprot:8422291-Pyramimonas_sp.AAC.1
MYWAPRPLQSEPERSESAPERSGATIHPDPIALLYVASSEVDDQCAPELLPASRPVARACRG